ncbi:branched-chain amino acid ABC transporter permease/ATP-binding protein [Yinghuangia seranimata]|uniref:branched-chain amino acid ABC transporter permease/ATP-binding protein n=1 Tax=Yinghuangia seranimata TaxID=408067 RepID=UPI00248CD072|nr:branched-chain amino acid ABC transporter permease/ATP-binding protein [Yinghuangia seranimata]MDI2124609.1 branched-chain amino acid ABC transporter permease/ATP-binding protein [Yinghuangia seranimata]
MITTQVLFDGLVNGMVFGLLAMGVVLVHRSTRVVNFAVGNGGLVGSGLFALLAVRYHVPWPLALPVALAAGTLFGVVMELAVIRRLFTAPRVVVMVATIGIAQIALLVAVAYPHLDERGARYPVPWSGTWQPWDGLRVTGPQLSVLVVVPVTAALLAWVLDRTAVGGAVRAVANNPDLARLSGISPKLVSTAVWGAAGLLSTISLILISGRHGSVHDLTQLGPGTLVRALAAAVLARMTSFRGALVAGTGIGVAEACVKYRFLDQTGLFDLVLMLGVLVGIAVIGRRGKNGRADEPAVFAYRTAKRPVPPGAPWWLRNIDRFGMAALLAVGLALPLTTGLASRQMLFTTGLALALCAASLTMVTGWTGQVSLGQMAFAGLGALGAATLNRGVILDLGPLGWVTVQGMVFPVAVLVAACGTAVLAAVVGLGALRVRGLMLAVGTFAFAIACEQFLYRKRFFSGDFGAAVPFPRTTVFGIDVSGQRAYYYLVLAVLVVVLAVVARLRASGIGRAAIAVRDNEDGAAAYTVAAGRIRVGLFALSGGIAGIGGALLGAALQSIPWGERYFLANDSLTLVAIAVIGGQGSVAGPVLGAAWVVGVPALFPGNALAPLLVSGIGLLMLLLYAPGGLVQPAYALRAALIRRFAPDPHAEAVPGPAADDSPRPGLRAVPRARRLALRPDGPVLETRDVRVAFGGLTAVDGVGIQVHQGEVVGLIGPNGAGKSTLMDAIGGYVPADGTVTVLGTDVSRLRPHHRAALGLGRTFQAARLFPELTVRETLRLALESRGRTPLAATALHLPHTFRAERARRAAADDLVGLLGLGRYADTPIAELSTGTRRVVELGGVLALDARVVCLDEPTAGLAQRETEAFAPLIHEVRRELGAALLVIEHDMPLIMAISDRVYCLQAGRVIAHGTPDAVRDDPAVIAGYLGTDRRAIERSRAPATAAH